MDPDRFSDDVLLSISDLFGGFDDLIVDFIADDLVDTRSGGSEREMNGPVVLGKGRVRQRRLARGEDCGRRLGGRGPVGGVLDRRRTKVSGTRRVVLPNLSVVGTTSVDLTAALRIWVEALRNIGWRGSRDSGGDISGSRARDISGSRNRTEGGDVRFIVALRHGGEGERIVVVSRDGGESERLVLVVAIVVLSRNCRSVITRA